MEYNEVLSELMKGTNFEISSESQVLTSCSLKVRTPIEVLNCLLGGGLPLNGVYHTWGEPKGGKSTWLYQTMGNFQKQYPEGICIILDMESSADPERLKALGIDVTKVMRLPATSIESGFLALFKILDNKKNNPKIKDIPLFIVWDTISRGKAQDDSTQSRMNAQDRARIIKNYMPDLEARIEDQPFFLGLINQVIYEADRYGNQHAKAGGGVALQHENHMSMQISYTSSEYDPTGSFILAKWSSMRIDKSKISPEIQSIPIRIDVTQGGSISERPSFLNYALWTLHYINDNKGWFSLDSLCKMYEGTKIGEYISSINKNRRFHDLLNLVNEDDLFYDILRYSFTEYISKTFSLQANIVKDYLEDLRNKVNSKLGIEDNPQDTIQESISEEVILEGGDE